MLDRREFCRWAALGAAAALPGALRPQQLQFPFPPAPASPLLIAIDAEREAQTIAGFGASGAFNMAGLMRQYPDDERARILDLLFSPTSGAGLSVVRNIVQNGDRTDKTFEPQPGVWDWQTDDNQVWLMHEAAQRGCTRFISTAWSPPAWMKTNNNIVGGKLRPDKYQAFAEYLAQYALGYRQHHGLDIFAISPQNEPDVTVKYASCSWDGEEYRAFVRDYLKPTWAKLGVRAQLMLGEPSTWTEEYVVPALEDPAAREAVDIVAAHAYFGDNKVPGIPIADRIGTFTVAASYNKPVWQTEVSSFNPDDPGMADALYWAKLLHFHLAENNVSGWLYWWLVSPTPNREALIRLDPQTKGWLPTKRLFAIGNTSRFVRPGAVRVAATSAPAPEVYVSAYKNGRQLIAVALNDNDLPFHVDVRVSGFPVTAAQAFRTSIFEDLRALPPPRLSGAGVESLLLPHTATTFVLS